MKDYFEALAARTLQPERGVQPRTRARFEDAGDVRERASAPGPIARVRSHAASAAGPDEPRDPSGTRSERAEAVRDGRPEASARADHRARALDGVQQADDPQRKQTSDARHTVRIHETPRIETSSPGADDGRASSELAVRGTEAIGPRTIAPDATHVAQPFPRVTRATDDAVTVRIHIGRIDVRAIVPASAPLAPTRESRRGIITLDEYVQKRGGAS